MVIMYNFHGCEIVLHSFVLGINIRKTTEVSIEDDLAFEGSNSGGMSANTIYT